MATVSGLPSSVTKPSFTMTEYWLGSERPAITWVRISSRISASVRSKTARMSVRLMIPTPATLVDHGEALDLAVVHQPGGVLHRVVRADGHRRAGHQVGCRYAGRLGLSGVVHQACQQSRDAARSRASWWALAWAVGEARRRGTRLLLVNVYRPPVAGYAVTAGPGVFVRSPDPDASRVAHGNALIRTAIAEAVGSMPGDVSAEQQVISGRPAVELARLVYGGDLLVLGSRHRGWLRRLVPGSVARSVARRTRCRS